MQRRRTTIHLLRALVMGVLITVLLVVFGPVVGRASGLDAWLSWKTMVENPAEMPDFRQVNGTVGPLKEVWIAFGSPMAEPTPSAMRQPPDRSGVLPGWISDGRGVRADDDRPPVVMTIATGWPFRAATAVVLPYEVSQATGRPSPVLITFPEQFYYDIHLFDFYAGSLRDRVSIPLRPIVGGMIGDILFWAAVVGLVSMKFEAARRARLLRKGCCVECGYDLRGSSGGACPECGGKEMVRSMSR